MGVELVIPCELHQSYMERVLKQVDIGFMIILAKLLLDPPGPYRVTFKFQVTLSLR